MTIVTILASITANLSSANDYHTSDITSLVNRLCPCGILATFINDTITRYNDNDILTGDSALLLLEDSILKGSAMRALSKQRVAYQTATTLIRDEDQAQRSAQFITTIKQWFNL